jgi:hypothetical protein
MLRSLLWSLIFLIPLGAAAPDVKAQAPAEKSNTAADQFKA